MAMVLTFSFVARLAWVLLVPNEQYSDSVWYDSAARHLAVTGEYGPDTVSAWFPPGYPFLLAAIYKLIGYAPFAGKLANVAIGVGMTVFTYLLGRSLVSTSVGLLGALLVACWPNLIFHTGILSSDLLAALGFVATIWLGSQPPTRWRVVIIGCLVGWMILVRPVSGILVAGVGLIWARQHALRMLLPVSLIAAAIVGSWTLRNYLTFGEPILIATNGGYNFWQVNHRFADGNDTFWPFVPEDDPEYVTMRTADEFTKNREGYRYALTFLRMHPDRFIALIPAKIFWLYHTDTSGLYEGALYAPMSDRTLLVTWILAHARIVEAATFRYYEILLVFAIGACIGIVATRRTTLLPLVAVPLLLTFFHLFFHAKDRFHIPLEPFIAILAVIALAGARDLVAQARSRRALRPG